MTPQHTTQIIHIHTSAPEKPQPGQPCNGCGVCCLSEPCPLAHLLFRKRQGACPALQWRGEAGRYACGLLASPETYFSWGCWLPSGLRNRLIRRWIASGTGCDSPVQPEDSV